MPFQPEFQVVVLAAGLGSRMSEITSLKPKCLLPVGAKPLIWYPLFKLQSSGFTDAIVVVLESQKAEIQAVLDKSDLEIKLDYATVSDSYDDLGTAGSLRLIHDRLKSDVLVVTCDLITDANLKGVLDTFRKHDASIAALLLQPHSSEAIVVPGPKSKHKPERDLIGIDAQTNRIVFLASASDFETDLTLPLPLLRKHTNVKMFSNLIDSHVYVLKNWIIKFLVKEKKFTSIKGDLLPHIIKKQMTKPQSKESVMTNEMENNEIYDYAKEELFASEIRNASSYNDHYGDLKSAYHGDCIRCYAYVAPANDFGVRVNTLPSFWSINNQIGDRWDKITNKKQLTLQHPKAEIKSNQIDNKCIIWEGAKLSDKTSFKNSIIGANTKVSSFSRVFNSIVMNNVIINEKVALENCIVCDDVVIDSNSNIKGCLIGSGHKIPSDSIHEKEILTKADRFMEF